jgi:hypothetical protein
MNVQIKYRANKKNCPPTGEKERRIRIRWIRLEWNGFNAFSFAAYHKLSYDTVVKAINEERNGPLSKYIRTLIGKLPLPQFDDHVVIPEVAQFIHHPVGGSANGGK